MIAAFRDALAWLGCAAHDVNLAVDESFKNLSALDEDGVENGKTIMNLIKTAKGLVSHVKRTRYLQDYFYTILQKKHSLISLFIIIVIMFLIF